LQQSQYRSDLDAMHAAREQERISEKMRKIEEHMSNLEKQKVISEYEKRKKDEDGQFKSYFAQTYKANVAEERQRKEEALNKEKSEDQ